jgi:sulfotransferase
MPTKHQFFFLSGLPRSGSTLLASLLYQNPHIHTEGNSPLLQYLREMHEVITTKGLEQLNACKKHRIAKEMVTGLADLYYANTDRPYVFDKSRVWTWTPNVKMLKEYITPNPKIIVLVRPIDQIIASFVNVYRQNNRADYNINAMLQRGTDPIMKAYECALMAMNDSKENCLFITYDYLINNTESTLKAIYNFIGLPDYTHDLSNIVNNQKENDVVYGLLGLHDIRQTIGKSEYKVELPEDVLNHCRVLNKQMGITA